MHICETEKAKASLGRVQYSERGTEDSARQTGEQKMRSMEDFRIWFYGFVFETLNIIAYLHDE